MVLGGLMSLYSAEGIWEKGLAFKAGRFFLEAEIRRSKKFLLRLKIASAV